MTAACGLAACVEHDEPVGATRAALDGDDDGVDDSVDNCVGVANPDQANSNEDAEDALSISARGDACDPQPVVRIHNESGGLTSAVTSRPMIESRVPAETLVDGGVPTSHVARNGLRFCECDDSTLGDRPADRLACQSSSDCSIGTYSEYDSATHTTTDWKTLTVDWAEPRFIDGLATTYDTIPSDELRNGGDEVVMDFWDVSRPGYRQRASSRWDVSGDGDDWMISRPTGWSSPDHAYTGVLLAHTPGDTDLEATPITDSFYATGTDYDAANRKLTFAYRSGLFQRVSTVASDPPSQDDEFVVGNFLPENECLACSFGFPDSFFIFAGCPTGNCDKPFLRFRESYNSDASGLFDQGVYQSMGEFVNDVVWLGVSEPRSFRGEGDGLQWAAVKTTGEAVKMVVGWDGKLVDVGVGAQQTAPGSRTNFGAVLSDEQRAVYVIGGMSQGQATGDLWTYDVDAGTWSSATMGSGGPREVLAASYLPAEHALLVLDVDDTSQTDVVRLMRVSLDGKAIDQLGSWTRTLTNTSFAMTMRDDGLGYVVACTDKDGDHTVLQFDRTSQGVSLASYVTEDGTLASSMAIARPLGVTVFVDDGDPIPVGYSDPSYSAATGSTPERCF